MCIGKQKQALTSIGVGILGRMESCKGEEWIALRGRMEGC